MIVYHGTTVQRARLICHEGLLPKPPSRRVWFAEDRKYAFERARTWARRTNDRAIVLTADVDLPALTKQLGPGRVKYKNHIVAIDGPVPASVLRWHPEVDLSATPAEVAEWLNGILRLDPYRGVDKRHPGVRRLAQWIDSQVGAGHGGELRSSEILEMARRWLPELFIGVAVSPQSLRAHPLVGTVHIEVDTHKRKPDPRQEEALELLDDPRAERRAKGLELLATIPDPDLVDWCAMVLDDESVTVRVAALRTMLRCDDAPAGVAEPLAASENRRDRAAAIAVLARHGGDEAPRWFERGLKDPSPCVRVAVAHVLDRLDPAQHRPIFELALSDPNPDVARIARRLTAGKLRVKGWRGRRHEQPHALFPTA